MLVHGATSAQRGSQKIPDPHMESKVKSSVGVGLSEP